MACLIPSVGMMLFPWARRSTHPASVPVPDHFQPDVLLQGAFDDIGPYQGLAPPGIVQGFPEFDGHVPHPVGQGDVPRG